MNIASEYFSFLEKNKIDYVVVGDTRKYPTNIDSDIDIVVRTDDLPVMEELLYVFSNKYSDIKLVQRLQHEHSAYYYVLATYKNKIEFLHPDVCSDYFRNGRFFLSSEKLLQDRVEAVDNKGKSKGFYVAKPKNEFIYYLLKKIDKQVLLPKHTVHLRDQWEKDPEGCKEEIQYFWSAEEVELLESSVVSNNWENVIKSLPQLQQSIHKKSTFSLLSFYNEFIRKIFRLLSPSGLYISILGPDGCGKSSVIEKILIDLKPAFRKTQYFHLRPHLGKNMSQNTKPIDDPHSQNNRGWLLSFIKIFYFLFDYLFGYIIKTRPMLVRSTFVVFDRYYYDLLVDPKRYRFSLPLWFAKFIGYFIPRPNLVILLDVPAEVIHTRKQEVSFEETFRQRDEYINIVSNLNNGVVIDAGQSLDKVVSEVNKAILDYMAVRMKRRNG